MEDFTKGEWKANTDYATFININTDSACIASVDVEGSVYSEEELANAHLIAAAPEMYKIIEGLCVEAENLDDIIYGDRGCGEAQEPLESVVKARAILKKARGE
ncbi:MAG: hypothetical protein GY951_05575 [Psychromonas sp.]|nr:hypothetical protein [Psychromonas sp.]